MSKAEKENRINSLAVTFLERQQIIPHPLAERVISAYKEGYHQAEKDLELSWEDIGAIDNLLWDLSVEHSKNHSSNEVYYKEVLNRFKKGKG